MLHEDGRVDESQKFVTSRLGGGEGSTSTISGGPVR
jgi:hypothetical protein